MHSNVFSLVVTAAALSHAAWSLTFNFEDTQLTKEETRGFSAIEFGDTQSGQLPPSGSCRAFPGTSEWPSDGEWKELNDTLNGALLKPIPVAAACYKGPHYNAARCDFLLNNASSTHFYLDDPLTSLVPWTEGGTCMAELNPTGNCTQGGFPVYVVNATTAKHVQAAVNFARNKKLRLVIKNTGHDFGGRSVGAGSLSIWTHNIKEFEFLPNYTVGEYTGMAAHYGCGVESWELSNHMGDHNISIVAPGGTTVGANGGWFGAGGHGLLTSTYGLGSDQALSLNVITADGKFVVADPETNTDLFWALRGGGPGTYGVVLSVVVKAYPSTTLATSTFAFTLGIQPQPPDGATTWNNSAIPSPPIFTFSVNDTELFWAGASAYYRHGTHIVDNGGLGYGYIYPFGNNIFTVSSSALFPGKTPQEVFEIMQPLYDKLNQLGINMTNPPVPPAFPYASSGRTPGGEPIVNTRYRSRLFPRKNWEYDALWARTFDAIRTSVEAGYTFHNLQYGPTPEIAGWPGRDSAVNPAWRITAMHAAMMEVQPVGLTASEAMARDARVGQYMDLWRAATNGSGAYMNEGDPEEPNWQQAFFGDNYARLLRIKRKWDPWGLFWAATTVGSEAWEVHPVGGYPGSQNGMLCRTGTRW
ncbi:FAD-binding domain-containing protein [Thozetella sp. PMI_491]|nr:FAD-binding domain-containing protein [Thozetella sp. PMI_491]